MTSSAVGPGGRAGRSPRPRVDKIASVLGVPAPQIIPTLVHGETPTPTTPLALVDEAAALLDLARRQLADPTPDTAVAKANHKALERLSGPHPKSRGKSA